ncbi:MAG: S9 family peptidase [Burkholderiaceae bacterium]|nr:S9 family peptidase [Burkholderiaceae bacterium]
MARKTPISVEHLWRMQRLGAPSLSPDGAQAVLPLASYDMDENRSDSALWLLSTLGGAPRRLTHCGDKDGQPRFAPDGHQVGFVARREQQGHKDETPQFYVIPVDGGEARRIGSVATGVDAFRWCPDGKRIVFISWVWPGLKGAKAQAKAMKAHKERKESGYVTSEALYRYWDHFVPEGRVPHLHLMDVAGPNAGRVRDLFEGTDLELARMDPDANAFDISPDGRRLVFAYDPAPEKRQDGRYALAELDLRSGRVETLAQDLAWDLSAPRYSPDGQRIAFIASHQAIKHTMPGQLAICRRGEAFEVVSAEWDHEVQAPLLWEDDGSAVLLAAEQRGRRHLWRFDIADRRAEIAAQGGWVQGYDKAAGTLVTVADGADHPARAQVHLPGQAPRRIESFNDALLATLAIGRHEEISLPGALGDAVQVWLFYPPGFDAKKKYPLLHVIHGGPHTAMGDSFHYRWNNPAFAAAGYVVAVVNYHGSSSFGHAFLDSITHRWGELELQDIEAATTELLKRPYIDAQRVHATGGSYGGYMVAWMNAHVPAGRYASYICHAGCFDWVGMFADDAWAWHAKELGGWYWDDMARVHAQSPHAHAGGMATPTLVIHGALDYRVPDAQGLAYYNTLKARGVPARLLWFPDENHWVLKPRNSRLWYREFFAWLDAHRLPDGNGRTRRAAPRKR